MENDPEERPRLSDADYEAADRALARNWPELGPADQKYPSIRKFLAEFHQRFGKDSFELRFRLRAPSNRLEELTRQFMHEEISEAEYGARLKADAERPIDLEMLTEFERAYESKLEIYSNILQSVVPDGGREDARSQHKSGRKIDKLVKALDGQMPLWIENLETVFDFLGEVRAGAGLGMVTVGEFEGHTAHWLAQLVFRRTVDAWRSCKGVSRRGRTEARSLYSASAIELFRKMHFPLLPPPQSLCERMMLDFNLGRTALKKNGHATAAPVNGRVVRTAMAGELNALIDNESRAAVLEGEMKAIVASAGQIFRPCPPPDCGLDAEIEFKDDNGQATGERVYLQLKSGDSHLTIRKSDGAEVFQIKKARWADYWQQQQFPVMLVIRSANGLIRWMDVRAYLREARSRLASSPTQIVFVGEEVNVESVLRLRARRLGGTNP